MRFSNQRGVGLLEVLVALLILAIAILGFAVMQLRAIEATSEGFNRVQAMSLARDLSEKIRLNREQVALYQSTVNSTGTGNASCYTKVCSAAQKVESDVAETKSRVEDAGMKISMSTCPNVNNGRHCIFIAWNKTEAKNGNASDESSCTITANGKMSYNEGSKCIVMEAY